MEISAPHSIPLICSSANRLKIHFTQGNLKCSCIFLSFYQKLLFQLCLFVLLFITLFYVLEKRTGNCNWHVRGWHKLCFNISAFFHVQVTEHKWLHYYKGFTFSLIFG